MSCTFHMHHMDVCIVWWEDRILKRSGWHSSEHDGISLLRGYGDGQEVAVLEGIVRYDHQGGGQEHISQSSVIYNTNNTVMMSAMIILYQTLPRPNLIPP